MIFNGRFGCFPGLVCAALSLSCSNLADPQLGADLASAQTLWVTSTPSVRTDEFIRSLLEILEHCDVDVSMASGPDADVVVAYRETVNLCPSLRGRLTNDQDCPEAGDAPLGEAIVTVAGHSTRFPSRSAACPTCLASLAAQRIGRSWCAAVRQREDGHVRSSRSHNP